MMLFLPGEDRTRYEETYTLAMLAGFGYYCGAGERIDQFARREWISPDKYSNDAGLVTEKGMRELGKRSRKWWKK